MPALTKEDIKALRAANRISVHLGKFSPQGCVVLVKDRAKDSTGFVSPHDMERELPAHVTIRYDRDIPASAQCFGHVYLYPNSINAAWSIIKTLKVGDELTFRFCPDAHTNGYVAAADLHADVMYLDVSRDGKVVAQWELQTSICPDNSARMCRGFPVTDSYLESAKSSRENA